MVAGYLTIILSTRYVPERRNQDGVDAGGREGCQERENEAVKANCTPHLAFGKKQASVVRALSSRQESGSEAMAWEGAYQFRVVADKRVRLEGSFLQRSSMAWQIQR